MDSFSTTIQLEMLALDQDPSLGASTDDTSFVDELFEAVTTKVRRMSPGKMTPAQRAERRREQRAVRRQSPLGNSRDRARRAKMTSDRKSLQARWLSAELQFRAGIVEQLQHACGSDQIEWLVGLLIESDKAIKRCCYKFWPAKDKARLVQVPEWTDLVLPDVLVRFRIRGSKSS